MSITLTKEEINEQIIKNMKEQLSIYSNISESQKKIIILQEKLIKKQRKQMLFISVSQLLLLTLLFLLK